MGAVKPSDFKWVDEMRHSAAHVMAAAIQELYPEAKFGIGPVIGNGFYYDIDVATPITALDLAKIEKRMRRIVERNDEFRREEMPIDQAIEFFRARDQGYKLDLLKSLKEKGTTSVSADEKEAIGDGAEMVSVYWTGAELGLFAFSPLVGAGLPLFTERGTIIREELEQYVSSLQVPVGYRRVRIPHIAKSDLYKTSGHWDKFEDDLFHVRSKKTDDEFVLKPMNCPHHTQIFASSPRSYRDLPIRMSEVTAVYRDEDTGQLHGLSRVRSITQDDAHVFCTMDQVEQEVKIVQDIIRKFYEGFGMPLRLRFSVHDPNNRQAYLGDDEVWRRAESMLEKSIRDQGHDFELGVGEAAFYGPKIDYIAKDAIGREWQLATCQLDFNLPERFQLEYTGEDGAKHRPVMIHRAVLGSIERFMGILIEHYAGAFPVWLSPVQVQVIPVSQDHWDTCRRLAGQLEAEGIRVDFNELQETVGYQIRKSEKAKVPYMLVIGDREKSLENLTVRLRGQKEEIQLSYAEFIDRVKKALVERSTEL